MDVLRRRLPFQMIPVALVPKVELHLRLKVAITYLGFGSVARNCGRFSQLMERGEAQSLADQGILHILTNFPGSAFIPRFP